VLAFLAACGSALACQVPVFRYALERWNADRYKVLILSPDATDYKHSPWFSPQTKSDRDASLVAIESVDMSKNSDARLAELWKTHGNRKDPTMIVFYPDKATSLKNQIAHTSVLSKDQAQFLLDSPIRQELTKRLSQGHSAVWLFLESGDKAKDLPALKNLEEQLAKDAQWLHLPSPEEMEIKPEVLERAKIKLKIEFSIVSLRRDDPKEKFLVDCLLNSEPDLREFQEPMAFPVFGRGIVLYALIGKGIGSDTIRTASSFIVGPCSCQVKEQNPGFDLLLDYDWDLAVGEAFISDPVPGTGAAPKLLKIPPGRSSR
jgi:hypothetical protein